MTTAANPAAAPVAAAKAGIGRLWSTAKSVFSLKNMFTFAAVGLASYALLVSPAEAFNAISGLVSTSAEGIWAGAQKGWEIASGLDWSGLAAKAQASVPSPAAL